MKSRLGQFLRDYIGSYVAIPRLAWCIFPLILLDTFVASICLNVSVYFTKVHHLSQFLIGEIISLYYVGSMLGALLGGALSLKFSSVKLSSAGFLLFAVALFALTCVDSPNLFKFSMFFLGGVGTVVSICNLSSFIKTAKDDAAQKLKLINLELVMFNLSFSLGAFVLLELNAHTIDKVLQGVAISLIVASFYAFVLRDIKHFYPPLEWRQKAQLVHLKTPFLSCCYC